MMAKVTTVVVPKPQFDALIEENERLKALLDEARNPNSTGWAAQLATQNEMNRLQSRLSAAEGTIRELRQDAVEYGKDIVELDGKLKRAEAVVEAVKHCPQKFCVPREGDAVRQYEEEHAQTTPSTLLP